MDLTIVVPTLNERGNILPLFEALSDALEHIEWEVVFVDDSSSDGTQDMIGALVKANTNVTFIERCGLRGLVSACICGMIGAKGTYVAVMDADGQHDPSVLPMMLQCFDSPSFASLVVASRYMVRSDLSTFDLKRKLLSRIGTGLYQCLLGSDISDPMSGFFVIRNDLASKLVPDLPRGGFKLLPNILIALPRDAIVAQIPFSFAGRRYGRSKVTARVIMRCALNLIGDAGRIYRRRLSVGEIGHSRRSAADKCE